MISTLDMSLLETPIEPRMQAEICLEFWGIRLCSPITDINLAAFWNYYFKTIAHSLHENECRVTTRTHRDIIDVVHLLKAGATRLETKQMLRSKLEIKHEDELLENSIDLAASLAVMCDCGVSSHGISGSTEIQWRHDSLRKFLATTFDARPILALDKVKLEKTFIARNINRIAGLEIIWTDNLVDHLRLAEEDTKVYVFHHASFLEAQRWGSQSLLPAALVSETLHTLALLFPSSDCETRKWISRMPFVDSRVARCGHLKTDLRQIETFQIWRDRLVMLKQVYDDSQPKTLKQWWNDRRNGVQWYMFWFAVLVLILTVIFGLIQSIEGAIQAYASLKAISGRSNL
ncbi:hypothetical protein F4680DRAFT_417266 [Xylaria scruposa]|nr:hypothetical protein F4680DRAFT_417266 [Xylaria scruposa]